MENTIDEALRIFASSGIRMTSQRELLLRVLYLKTSHPTAEELYNAINAEHPGVLSRTTVYNNLRALKGVGLVKEFYLHNSGAARYDTNTTPHHHLCCTCCGRIQDYTGTAAEHVQAASIEGFRAESVYKEISGVCGQCQAAPAALQLRIV
ncbi:Fur family transcriptional regulator [Paenibacillus xerothermodurans]|uniref:Transcriptional repressor n=1 Tax=Paenibacillus xerothermodurans TaxID=1977292 RepID=A0A2W1NRX4_PAEXE|nr:Fur family transcriptional regulator [Paenibacillus xerothermodurans]PZE22305.1 transcriptional repressor [Paenibacillus xerothermodurans]